MRKGDAVGPELVRQIAARLSPQFASEARRAVQRKWDILIGNVRPHAEKRLYGQYTSDVAREGTRAQISRTFNPAADIVGKACQVYKAGIKRRVSGVSKAKNKALTQLYREARAGAMGPDWNREGYFVGPDTVVPHVRSGRMTLQTVLPHRRVPVLDEADPCGKPLAVAYEASRDGEYCLIVVVDQHSTSTYGVAGGQIERVGQSLPNSSLLEDCQPFAELRFDTPRDPCDYDSSWRHQRLADGTIDCVVVAAVMGHVRKTQNKQLLYLQGALDSLLKGQNLGDPDKPVFIPTPTGQENAMTFGKLDFDQPIENFVGHARFLYAAMAESTGVPAMISTEGPIDLQFAYDGLSELRDEQIQFVEEFERELCLAMVMAAVDGGHPVALELPTLEEVKKGFTIQLGKMSRRLADPMAEQQTLDWEVRHGLISVLDLLAKRFPDLDDEALTKKLKETLEINTQYWDMMARTNMAGSDQGGVSVDPSGKAVTVAQANGAKGGRPANESKQKAEGAPNVSGGKRGAARGPAGSGGRRLRGRRQLQEGAGGSQARTEGDEGRAGEGRARQAGGSGGPPSGARRGSQGAGRYGGRAWLRP